MTFIKNEVNVNKLTEEDDQISRKWMKSCTVSSIIWEMKIKTLIRYYYTPPPEKTVNTSVNTNMCGVTGMLIHYWGNLNLYNPNGKLFERKCPLNLNKVKTLGPSNSVPEYIPNRNNCLYPSKSCPRIFKAR